MFTLSEKTNYIEIQFSKYFEISDIVIYMLLF